MAKFMVQVLWAMVAQVSVEADTLEEAVEKQRQQTELPTNGVYLDDSCEVSGDNLFAEAAEIPMFPGYCGPGQGPGPGQVSPSSEVIPKLCGTPPPRGWDKV